MIFFGSKGKTISGQLVEGIECPSCQQKQFITFGLIRYFHLYWIPTFITSKKAGIECTHCKKTLIGKELPKELSNEIKKTLFNKKNTLPLFTGTIILVSLITFGFVSAIQADYQEASYIEQPVVNDLYVVDFSKIYEDYTDEYKYGVLKLKQLDDLHAVFQVSLVVYTKTAGVDKDIRDGKAITDDYYDTEMLSIDINHLKAMKEKGVIKDIVRN